MCPSTPTTFAKERFRVTRELGKGGMGIVYEALDTERDMLVALKTLLHLNSESLYYFKREFRALHDLVHPNLCSFMELIEDDGAWFITMELIQGVDFLSYVENSQAAPGSLSSVVRNQLDPYVARSKKNRAPDREWADVINSALFDETKLRRSLAGLCEGLNALHEAGKVHRDIKPSNVMVTKEDRVVLLDFGLITEKEVQRLTELGTILGTVEYMAPEQARSEVLGPEADWYAVGVMLYEALTGKLPFHGSPLKMLIDKESSDPVRPSVTKPGLPEDLEMLCVDLLKRDPQERPKFSEILNIIKVDRQVPMITSIPAGSTYADGSLFVGRHSELAALRTAYREASAGSFGAVIIEGVSGVGKSALVENFTSTLLSTDPSAVILKGRCYERETAPFKAFDGVIESIIHHLRSTLVEECAELIPHDVDLLFSLFPALRRSAIFGKIPQSKIEIEDPHVLQSRSFGAFKDFLMRLSSQHPLVLIIDDMQWADSDSLSLFKQLVSEDERPPLLLILLSRFAKDAEESVLNWDCVVGEDHKRIQVMPLDEKDSKELALLLVHRENIAHVDTESIAHEAAGHPLYIAEIIRHITHGVEDWKSLRLDDVIWNRVKTLPPNAKQVLKTVCVAGTPIEREHLQQLTSLKSEDFFRCIKFLRSSNLIRSRGPRSNDLVEPYHDRVREAVVRHLDSKREQRNIHLKIGRFFLTTYSETELDENIFSVIRHLHAARDLIEEETQKMQLAKLYLLAGKKARASAAFAASLRFLTEGISLLQKDYWEIHYEFTLALYEEAAEAAHLNTDPKMVKELTDTVFKHSRHILHAVKATEVRILSLSAEDKKHEALQLGIEFLKELGLNVPWNPEKLSLGTALLRTKASLFGKTDETLLNLPPMTDKVKLATMRLLSAMSMAAYHTNRNLYSYFIFIQVFLISKFGHCIYSSNTFCSYGMILCGKLGDVEDGYRFGKLAQNVIDSYFDATRVCRTKTLSNAFLLSWKEHPLNTIYELHRAYDIGMASGDFQYSGAAIAFYIERIMFGGYKVLGDFLEEIRDYHQAVKNKKQSFWAAFIALELHIAVNLVDNVADPMVLDGEVGSEKEIIEIFRREGNEFGQWGVHLSKILAAVHFGEFERGTVAAKSAREFTEYHVESGHPTSAHAQLFEGIIYLRATSDWHSAEGKTRRRLVRDILKYLEKKAIHGPMNYLYMVELLRAENYRANGKVNRASKCYEQAVQLAAKDGHISGRALASGLAADFYFSRGEIQDARKYAREAQSAYQQWGAFAILRRLEEKYRDLFGRT